MTAEHHIVQPNHGSEAESSAAAPMQIILVDDDAGFLTLMRLLIQAAFPQAVIRSTAHGLAALAAHTHVRADVIVADYRMPAMDGIELVEHLRLHPDSVPVVIVSSEPTIAFDAMKAGATGFLVKSQIGEDLVPLLSRLLAGQR